MWLKYDHGLTFAKGVIAYVQPTIGSSEGLLDNFMDKQYFMSNEPIERP